MLCLFFVNAALQPQQMPIAASLNLVLCILFKHCLTEFTFKIKAKSNQVPTGGNDNVHVLQNDIWFWSDGSKFEYTYWRTSEPNNSGGVEHCVVMGNGGNIHFQIFEAFNNY